ncbi:MAG: universal stress protein [Balneolales bacterium]|nr:universal stress protein [Balneolales bacterium]
MSFPTKWLIATNGSKYASEAVKHAGLLSAELKVKPEVTILVVASSKEQEDVALGIVEMAKFLFEEEGQKIVEPNLEVRIGAPGDTIIKTAHELGCDHILIGGADFKWDVNEDTPGGISNYVIANFQGVITVVK